MGASLGSGSGSATNSGSRRSRSYRKKAFSEINVTPMVDVMLVLLIIFMVTAPMLTAGVQVELPKTQSSPLQGQDEPLTVTIQKNHKVYIQNTVVEIKALGARLKAISKENLETRIFVRGDKDVDYGSIMQAMGEIHAAGFNKVALITEQAQENSSRKER